MDRMLIDLIQNYINIHDIALFSEESYIITTEQ